MATTSVDQITGYGETVAYKAPCRLATTANITLSGLQTIDGSMTATDDRVLVKNQSAGLQNGIYIASAGAWQRARDMDSNRDLTRGTRLTVIEGTANAGREYYVSTANPITVGTTSLAFTETLSSNAGASAVAAAASATAAAGSATAASTSATNAANSATAANTSKNNAATSESNAATSATNAANSATAANTSKNNAATSETNAGNSATAAAGSATAASGSATAASGSATTASTQATNAGNSATAAAASATAAANTVAAVPYTFSTTTTDADPGNGTFRLNNATIASATAAYIDNQDSDAVSQTGFLDTFDDSTNTIKGKLTIRSKTSAAVKYVFNVTGSVVDGTGYRKLTLAYVSGSGSITNGMACWLMFDRTGDKGTDGLGTGDASGPASSVSGNLASFNGTTGKLLQDSGVAASNVAKLNTANSFSVGGQSVTTAAGQAIGVSGGPAAGTPGLMINSLAGVGNAAFMSFNRNGAFAGNFGIDTDNKWKFGGWSHGANAYAILHEGLASGTYTGAFTWSGAQTYTGLSTIAGVVSAGVSDGTVASGTYTPNPTTGNFRTVTFNGALTFAAPSLAGAYNMEIDITNGASAGAITWSGFVSGFPKGDAYVTTSAAKFKLHISKTAAGVTAVLEALQ